MNRLRRKHRLPDEAYQGQVTVAFTACLANSQPLLANDPIVQTLIPMLQKSTSAFDCTVPIYCFMPDHLHLVIRGSSAESDSKAAIDEFKSLSGSWFYREQLSCHWQEDYWDHVIRFDADWKEQVRYVAHNPMTAGLIKDFREWPYLGSIGHDLQEILIEAMF